MSERRTKRSKAMRGGRTLPAVLAAVLAAAGLAGSAVAPAGGQVKSAAELSYPPLPEVEFPQPRREVLDNGMVVILLEDHELPLVEAQALVRTGARLEPAAKAGLAELAGAVLRTGGTESMDPAELDLFLESKAAAIESAIGLASGNASMSCLAEDLSEVLQVFADVLRRPAFDEQRLEVERTQLEAAIARQNDDQVAILFREMREILYGGDSAYARAQTYASVGAIGRDDLVAWHASYYHPNRIVLGLVGDFESDAALALVRQVFGDWPSGPSEPVPVPPAGSGPGPGVYFVEKPDVTQSAIAMGHVGIRRDHPDYYAVEVMNQVLSGSFASRLFSNVRSRKGLAYSVSGGLGSQWDHEGVFQMWLTTKVETTGAAIEALVEEARNLTAKPPSDAEVAKAKEGILNSFVFNSDSRAEILAQQLLYEYFGYPLDWLERYRAGVEAVTSEEVRAAAAEHVHPDRLSILVVGPAEGQDKPLSEFGKVTTVDITIPPPPAGG